MMRWKHGGRISIYSPPQSDFGLRGGYEIWEIEIGKAIDEQMTKDWRARERFPEKHRHIIRAAFLDTFFREKAQLPLDKPKRLIINLLSILGESEKHTFAIDIPVEALNTAWDTAYRQILNLAKENIQLVAQRQDFTKVFILLSGGSIANSKAKMEIMEFCNTWGRLRSHRSMKNKITVKVMKDIQTAAWKWTLAQGAAKSLATTMDVEEFFDRGAALGIQSSTIKGNFTAHTSGAAKRLLNKVRGLSISACFDDSTKDNHVTGSRRREVFPSRGATTGGQTFPAHRRPGFSQRRRGIEQLKEGPNRECLRCVGYEL